MKESSIVMTGSVSDVDFVWCGWRGVDEELFEWALGVVKRDLDA